MAEALKKAGLATDADEERVRNTIIRDNARAEAALKEEKEASKELSAARRKEKERVREFVEAKEKLEAFQKQGVRQGIIQNWKDAVKAREREMKKAVEYTQAAEKHYRTVGATIQELARTM
jgi:FMN phosphatase YigB (HAD superfamily)